jgi:putative DNA primase/helicase
MYIQQGQVQEIPASDGRPVTSKLFASVYQFILANFPCELEEQKHLAKRWFKDFSNFGTMPFHNAAERSRVAKKLYDMHGDAIYGVPGISKNCPSGKGSKPWLEGPEGLLIPVRDYHGEILSIMIRPRVQGDGPKYLFMSSSRHGGSSAKPTLHFPRSFRKMHDDETWITEGYLKAEILCDVHGLPTLGTPANNLEPAHWYIASNPLESWVLAYDMDTNEAAKRTTSKNLLKAFARYPDSDIKLAIWDPANGKGLDDLLQAGGTYQILDRQEAIKYLSQYATLDEQEELDEKEYYRTEWSEAKSLMGSYGKDMTFIPEWNDFLIWNGKIWEKDSYGPAILYKKHLDERLKSQLAKLAGMAREDALKDGSIKWLMSGHKLTRLNNVVSHLKSEVDMRKKVQEIPVVRNVITCPNGTVDLSNGELRNPKRSDWQQAFCPTKFDPQAQCPRWLKLLDDVFLGSQPLIHYVQKLFGMAITGQPNDHLFPVFVGDGRNGKSTILGTIQQVLGSGLAGAVDSNHLCKGNDRHPTWLSSFHGKRLMVAQETARGAELNVSLVKSLTGGDQITCRRMHENEWTFLPTHTLILCTNERPNIPESNTAIWARIALVPFKASFSVENGNLDTTLPVKILEESEGILNWLVQGSLLYQKEGLTKPDEIVKQVQEYREDNDPEQSIHMWLDQFTFDHDIWIRSGELYQHYYQWTLTAAIKALGIKNFTIAMSKQKEWERRTQKGYREFKKVVTKQMEIQA